MRSRRPRRSLDQLLDEYAEALLLSSVACPFTIVPPEAWQVVHERREIRELECRYLAPPADRAGVEAPQPV